MSTVQQDYFITPSAKEYFTAKLGNIGKRKINLKAFLYIQYNLKSQVLLLLVSIIAEREGRRVYSAVYSARAVLGVHSGQARHHTTPPAAADLAVFIAFPLPAETDW